MWICHVVKYLMKEIYSIVLIQAKLSAFFPLKAMVLAEKKNWVAGSHSFYQVPYSEKTCIFGSPDRKDIALFLFNSQLYGPARILHLQILLGRTTYWDRNLKNLSYFLQGKKKKFPLVFNRTAKLIVRAIVRRTHFIEQTEVPCNGFI